MMLPMLSGAYNNNVIAHLLTKDPELLFAENSTPLVLRFGFGRHSSIVDFD